MLRALAIRERASIQYPGPLCSAENVSQCEERPNSISDGQSKGNLNVLCWTPAAQVGEYPDLVVLLHLAAVANCEIEGDVISNELCSDVALCHRGACSDTGAPPSSASKAASSSARSRALRAVMYVGRRRSFPV